MAVMRVGDRNGRIRIQKNETMQLKPIFATDIQNLIFDFGGVLLDIDIQRTVRAFQQLGLTGLRNEEIHPHNSGIFLELELGQLTTAEFVERLQQCVPNGWRKPSAEELLAAWNALLLDYDWRRFELLDNLKRSGYRLFLLSNTNLPHRECFVERFNRENPTGRTFESYFEVCFYSDAMHLRKPDEAIYRAVLEQAEIDPAHTLFIDDNRPNTEGAERLGIRTVHLASPLTVLDLFE